MAQNQIRGGQIRSGTVANAQVADNAEIALSKIAGGVALDGQITDLENWTNLIKVREVPSGSVNGSNVTFTLANTPVVGSEQVYLNGLLQDPGAGNSYTIAGAVITFLSAPLSGDEVHVSYATGDYMVAPAVAGSGSVSTVDYGSVYAGESFGNSLYNSAAVTSDGYLLTWGLNNVGQLGLGDTTNRYAPIRVGSDSTWTRVSCGKHWAGVAHTEFGVAAKSNGTLWSWGYNGYGQLGDNTNTQRNSPVQVGSDSTWTGDIATGVNHVAAIKSNGTLWTWGYNRHGELGLGDAATNGSLQRRTPTQVGSGTNWSKVAAGDSFTLAIKTDGTLWGCGYNGDGRVGDGTTTQRNSFVQIGSDTNWADVSCGIGHAIAVKTNGTLWAWGANGQGQLGNGTTTDRTTGPLQIGSATNWSKVAAGYYHSLAIKTDGTLWACGRNAEGQLGDGTTTQRTSLVQVGTATDWDRIAAGYYMTSAVKIDGPLFMWGDNYYGGLGDGTTVARRSSKRAEVDFNF